MKLVVVVVDGRLPSFEDVLPYYVLRTGSTSPDGTFTQMVENGVCLVGPHNSRVVGGKLDGPNLQAGQSARVVAVGPNGACAWLVGDVGTQIPPTFDLVAYDALRLWSRHDQWNSTRMTTRANEAARRLGFDGIEVKFVDSSSREESKDEKAS